MRRCMVVLACGALVLGLSATGATADWNDGDPHKMHFPQLPDPTGWDVDVTTDFVYDDWRCSGSGPVSDIHFWASSQGDGGGPLERIIIEIWSDVPVDDPGNQLPFSHPGGTLWQHTFYPGDWMMRGPEFGDQGWYAPNPDPDVVIPNDHVEYYQFNFENFDNPFLQEQGTIYWLGIHMIPVNATDAPWGWKTSMDHWNDDATYYLGGWNELRDPFTQESLDMAFVITPEPATLALMMVGGALLLRRRN